MRGHTVRRQWLAILLVSLAGLLLEVGYTRIVSYKLWYYYTYLVIGLSLLGIGSGGVFVAVCEPVRRWRTDRIIGVCSLVGAVHDRRRLPRDRPDPIDTHRDLGLRHAGVVPEPRRARLHLLHALRRRSSPSASSSRCCSGGPATGSAASTSPTSSAPGSAACSRSRSSRASAHRASSRSPRSCSPSSGLVALPWTHGPLRLGSVLAVVLAVAVVGSRRAARRARRGREGRRAGRAVLRVGAGVPRRRRAVLRGPAEPAPRCTTARYGSGIWELRRRRRIAETRFETDPRAIPFGILGDATGARADHRLGGRPGDPRLAVLRRAARRGGRAQPGHRSRCSPITSPTSPATSPTVPTSTSTKATAVPTSRAATARTTSSGSSRPTATRPRTRRRRARSCCRRATCTRPR